MRIFCTVLLLLFVSTELATAQLKRNNFTRSSRLSPSSSNLQPKQIKGMDMADQFKGKTLNMQQWNSGSMSRLGNQRANFGMNEQFLKSNTFNTSTKEYPEMDRETSLFDGQQAYLENLNNMRDVDLVKRYEDAIKNREMLDGKHFSEMRDMSSLRDINEFAFRENRSDGPIPIQRAGSGDYGDREILPDGELKKVSQSMEDVVLNNRSTKSRRTLDLGDPKDVQNTIFAKQDSTGKSSTATEKLRQQRQKIITEDMPKSFVAPGQKSAAEAFITEDSNTKVKKEGGTTITVRVK